MRKIILLLILSVTILGACSYAQPSNEEIMQLEQEASFNLLWETANIDASSPGYGLARDRYPANPDLASIAATGFYLASIPVGVENEWITYEEGYDRALTSLQSLQNLPRVEGFYYHFYSMSTGQPSDVSEVSSIDTALFISGAIVAGEYFGGEVKAIADEIYKDINWQFFVDPTNNQFYMAYDKTTDEFNGHWDYYAEGLVMYVLAAGSPTYPVNNYDSFIKDAANYEGYDVIYSWFGSAFTYQYSHAFIDFSCYVDPSGINWYENSVNAAYASQAYAINDESKTSSEVAFGMTASDSINGYNGTNGSMPSGSNSTANTNDGTIAPTGAIGFLPFAPEIVLPTFSTFYNVEGLIGEYGFYDAYNLDTGWVAPDYIGIDKGIEVLMIENYKTNLVTDTFMKNEYVLNGMENIGFIYDETQQYCK